MTIYEHIVSKFGEKAVKQMMERAVESSNAVEGINVSVKGVIQDAEDYYKN